MEKIKIRVVKDSFWNLENVQKEVEKALREFKRQFKIEYEIVEIGEWNPIRFPGFLLTFLLLFGIKILGRVVNNLIDQLQRIRRENEIIIGFTGKLKSPYTEDHGWYAGGCILIGICKRPLSYVVLHELGHAFGAQHTENRKSVMHRERKIICYDFDDENKKIIRKNLSSTFKGDEKKL